MPARKTVFEKFAQWFPEPRDGCWPWGGPRNNYGYGKIRNSGGAPGEKVFMAHRVAYEVFVGPIPAGLEIDHLCRTRHCVNPSHMEPVTPKENWRRGLSPTAIAARRQTCPKGHPLSGDNLYVYPHGGRCCRTCQRAAAREIDRRRSQKPERRASLRRRYAERVATDPAFVAANRARTNETRALRRSLGQCVDCGTPNSTYRCRPCLDATRRKRSA